MMISRLGKWSRCPCKYPLHHGLLDMIVDSLSLLSNTNMGLSRDYFKSL